MSIYERSNGEAVRIHEKSLYLLEHVGVDFEHPELLEFFKGKNIMTKGSRVYFDKETVEKAVASLPKSFIIKTPYAELKIGEGGRALVTSGGARIILKDGKLCPPTMEDFITARKLDDTSKVLNLLCPHFINVEEIPKEQEELVKMAVTLKYSKKPLMSYCSSKKNAEETLDFVRDFYDIREGCCTIGVGNVISPLRYSQEVLDGIMAYVKRDQPIIITCCSMPGMTSPITVGGTIVQNNAEVMAGIIMTQLLKPGAPVVYGNVTFSSDMRSAIPLSWSPEVAIFMQYAKTMADYYGLPCRTGGSLSVAKDLDWQDGAEAALSLRSTLDSRSDFVFHSCGQMDCLNVYSHEKYVLDEELLTAMISVENRNFLSDEEINLESIEEVGPGGNYLLEDDTLNLYQSELFLPKLFNCGSYQSWIEDKMPTVVQRANELMCKRLAEYKPPQYDQRQNAMLKEVLSILKGRNL